MAAAGSKAVNEQGLAQKRRGGEHRILLNDADNGLLSDVAEAFGLRRSETVRRLLRAATDVGPALSAQNSQIVVDLSVQVRAVGRNLAQVLRAIHAGHGVGIADLEPILTSLHARASAVDQELSAITIAYGLRLRRSARLAEAGADA